MAGRPFATLDAAFESGDNVIPDSEGIRVSFLVQGISATRLKTEASRRGVSVNDMANILMEQGMFFWIGKA